MKISDIMTRDVQTVSPNDTIRRAAQMMDELNVGVLPVCDGHKLVGIVTDRDITVRATSAGLAPESCKVAEVMTEGPRYCYEDDPVNEAIEELVAPYRADTPSHRGSPWRDAFERTTLFSPLEERLFDNPIEQDADGIEARVGSISFIAALDAAELAQVRARARAIAGRGTVTIPYRTEVHTCRRL